MSQLLIFCPFFKSNFHLGYQMSCKVKSLCGIITVCVCCVTPDVSRTGTLWWSRLTCQQSRPSACRPVCRPSFRSGWRPQDTGKKSWTWNCPSQPEHPPRPRLPSFQCGTTCLSMKFVSGEDCFSVHHVLTTVSNACIMSFSRLTSVTELS